MRRAIITILGLICAVLIGYGIAHAETDIYLTYESEGAGYDAGYGLRLEYLQRWDRLALHGQINAALQHKHGADDGIPTGREWKHDGFLLIRSIFWRAMAGVGIGQSSQAGLCGKNTDGNLMSGQDTTAKGWMFGLRRSEGRMAHPTG